MEQFFKAYYENMMKAISDGKVDIDNIDFNCEFCPLREKCRTAAENDDTRTCGQFIKEESENV